MRHKTAALLIVAIAALAAIPAASYQIIGDTTNYLSLAENIFQGNGYRSDVAESVHFPPGFPLSVVPFLAVMKNVHAIKAVSIAFTLLCLAAAIALAKKMRLDAQDAFIVSLLILFNPFFFYYTLGFPLSESLTAMLLTSAALFLHDMKPGKKMAVGFGLLGLATLTRYTAGAFLAVFSIYAIVKWGKGRRVLFMLIAGWAPVIIWLGRILYNRLAFSSTEGAEYVRNIYKLASFPENTIILLMTVPLALLLMTPLLRYTIKERDTFILLILVSAAVSVAGSVFLSSRMDRPFLDYAIGRARYYVPVMPLLFLSLARCAPKKHTRKRHLAIAAIIFSAALMAAYNYGPAKDATDRIVELPPTYSQIASHRADATAWINRMAPRDTALQGEFVSSMTMFDHYYKQYLREDIRYSTMKGSQENSWIISEAEPREGWKEIYRKGAVGVYMIP